MDSCQSMVQGIKKKLLCSPWGNTELALILPWIPVIHRPQEKDTIAWTEGHCIFLGETFYNLDTDSMKRSVILHELQHILYQHVQRRGNRIPEVWGIAADLMVNFMIELYNEEAIKLKCREQPYFSLDLEKDGESIKILNYRNFIKPQDLRSKPFAQWSCEEIYNYLLENNSIDQNFVSDLVDAKAGSGGKGLTKEELDSLPEDIKTEVKLSNEASREVWQKRIEDIKDRTQGDGKGNLLGSFNGEKVANPIDWVSLLRYFVTQRVSNNRVRDWSRPGRANQAINRTRKGQGSVITRGLVKEKKFKTICVALDTSGSVMWDEKLLAEFCLQIDSIQAKTKADLYLIFADCYIEGEKRVKFDKNSTFLNQVKNRQITMAGGGGTSFEPAVRRMHDIKADVYIYLTDGYGYFPEANTVESRVAYNLIWVMNTNETPTVGKVVRIEV